MMKMIFGRWSCAAAGAAGVAAVKPAARTAAKAVIALADFALLPCSSNEQIGIVRIHVSSCGKRCTLFFTFSPRGDAGRDLLSPPRCGISARGDSEIKQRSLPRDGMTACWIMLRKSDDERPARVSVANLHPPSRISIPRLRADSHAKDRIVISARRRVHRCLGGSDVRAIMESHAWICPCRRHRFRGV